MPEVMEGLLWSLVAERKKLFLNLICIAPKWGGWHCTSPRFTHTYYSLVHSFHSSILLQNSIYSSSILQIPNCASSTPGHIATSCPLPRHYFIGGNLKLQHTPWMYCTSYIIYSISHKENICILPPTLLPPIQQLWLFSFAKALVQNLTNVFY